MRLTRVEIHGFKSFADRTPLDLPAGLTAIVGPNGCGKSNVIDAVKWALGEQRPSALRGVEMLDVIFKGNGARPARNFAEVSLHFDNHDGVLPVEYSEVVITRRLFRGGESEYLVNRQPVRLKDVRNLLLDTGLGTGAYSVMEQGRIDAILSANPVDRRRIFEEAAGISRYRSRRRESESKLERTEQNLLRLGDVLEELQKREHSLRVQAGRARSFLEARDRLHALRALWFRHQWGVLGEQLAGQEQTVAEREAAETLARAELEATRVEFACLQDELGSVREEVDRAADAFRQTSSEVEALGERESQLRERLAELGERQHILADRTTALQRALAERRQEAARLLERRDAAQREVREAHRSVEELAVAAMRAEETLSRARQAVGARRQEALERVGRLTEARNWKAVAESRRAGVVASTSRLRQQVDGLERQRQEQAALQGELFAGARDLDATLERARARLEERRRAQRELEAALGGLDEELSRRREALVAAESRHEALAELVARREGVSSGALGLLRSDLLGIEGLLVEHLRVPVELAQAVEAALGPATQAILVARRADALAALAHLRQVQGGRVLLVARDTLRPPRPAAEGVRLLDRLHALAHGDVFEALLGHVRLVDRAELARCVPDGQTLWVSPEGDLLDEHGLLAGGAGGWPAGLVARRAELDELVERCRRLRQESERLAAERDRQQADLLAGSEQLHQAEELVRRSEGERERTREKERESADRRAALDREVAVHRAELATLEDELAQLDRELAEASGQERDLASVVAADHGVQERAETELRHLEEAVGRAQQELVAGRMAFSAESERAQALEAEDRQIERAVREREEAAAQAAGERSSLEERRAQLDAQRHELAAHASALGEERDRRAGHLDDARRRAQMLGSRFEEHQTRAVEKERRLEEASRATGEGRLQSQETRVRRDELRRVVLEELELDLSAESRKGASDGEDVEWSAVAAEIDELRGKVARMGNVNLAAVDELAEVEERLEYLTGQRDDLLEARQSLTETIARVDRESRERFITTFEQVRGHFRGIFRKLFRGGRADVHLEEGVDVLEAGIEVTAAPPGKDARSITLLSGGERTLTAVGLLFALFRARPSPVCLLDEVDAALDETNIDRFCSVLEDFLAHSQFIVVTHARRTMSYADTLFGVTMQEHGVSKVLALSLEEYEGQRPRRRDAAHPQEEVVHERGAERAPESRALSPRVGEVELAPEAEAGG